MGEARARGHDARWPLETPQHSLRFGLRAVTGLQSLSAEPRASLMLELAPLMILTN